MKEKKSNKVLRIYTKSTKNPQTSQESSRPSAYDIGLAADS
jgi:hypothetical protein